MLAEAASKLKAGAGPSDANTAAPADALAATIFAPNPYAPAPADLRQKGVVEAAASEDEDTCSGLVFKRKRGVDIAVPMLSTLDGCVPSFRENPPSAFSPRDLVIHKGGGESSPGGYSGAPSSAELPAFLQEVLQTFLDGEMVESQGEDPLRGHAARGLVAFLVTSSRALTQVQELRAEMLKLREAASQDALQIKKLTQRETALYLELANLRQTDKETKRLLFE